MEQITMWNSPVPETRWVGFRRMLKGAEAFTSLSEFEKASLNELTEALSEHETVTLGRLLARGKKLEIEMFVRTHGPNPLFDPHKEIEVPVGVAKADVVSISDKPTPEATALILEGHVVHVLFQAGDATRFQEGPFYSINPISVANDLMNQGPATPNGSGGEESTISRETLAADVDRVLQKVVAAKAALPKEAGDVLGDWPLGAKQPLLIRAALRRIVQWEIEAGRLSLKDALPAYQKAVANQKLLFFVSRRGGVSERHDQILRKDRSFFGFDPANVVTIEQELARGITADERGQIKLLEDENYADAAGHLYALIQAARPGDFTTYTESGRPIKPMEVDALSYLSGRGARVLNIIRINDMDRHTTEIINPKALSYALTIFQQGYVNAVETVANPVGQKGGTGITFGDPLIHVLTETHENSFPALSRAFETAMKVYLQENNGNHPAYNAMRQWADLAATRRVLKQFGGRIVFVPRQREMEGNTVSYLGVDMPMGDLSLLLSEYKSRMFQFCGPTGGELLIHDMKKKENLPLALETILRQMSDPHVVAAAKEVASGEWIPFSKEAGSSNVYGAPAPEFE